MMSNLELLLDLGELPFHLGHRCEPTNRPFPETLPFAIGIDQTTGILVQMPDSEVSKHLRDVYTQDSIFGTPMDDTPLGKGYAEDFLQFLCAIPAMDFAAHPRVLEIGCGTGYLLHRIRELGGDVTGIEPGREGQIGAQKYGLPIHRALFDRNMATSIGKFDLVITYGVLEHIEALDSFLRLQIELLNDGGVVAAAVPDETGYYESGDVSMFVHEHWWYFTPGTLRQCLLSNQLDPSNIQRAGYGGSLYAAARPRADANLAESATLAFPLDQIQFQVSRLRNYLERASDLGRSVGIYCPSRALNLLHLSRTDRMPRFFDDDERLHGMFYPPFQVAIEPRQSLVNRPVDELLIMSRTFGKTISQAIQHHPSMHATQIRFPDDVLSGLPEDMASCAGFGR